MRKAVLNLSVAVALLFGGALVTPAHALLTGICSSDNPGQCDVSVSQTGSTATIVITNTSPGANGGFITAIAFDVDGTASYTGGTFTTTDTDFSLFTGPIPTPPPGSDVREYSIGLTADWTGGGDPNDGIGVGSTATFTVQFSNASWTELGILSSMDIRFRGFKDEGSDKDGVCTTCTRVPEPASLLLLGAGLAGLGIWRRKQA